MTKALFITYYWPPSGGAGVQRGLKFVKYLPEFGVRPIVLTVDPERGSYPSIDASLLADVPPDTEVIRTDSFEPLKLLAAVGGKGAVPHAGFAGTHKEGFTKRVMRWVRGNLMIPDARRGWVKHAVKAATEVIEREDIRTVLITSPPHSSQLIGLALKLRFPHLRWIADLRDPWTDIYFAKELMKGPRARRLDARYEADVLSTADAIVVVGPSMKRSFADRYGAEVGRKITVITNGYDAEDLDVVRGIEPRKDRFRIAYVGTMAASYAPRVFFDAVALVARTSPRPIELRFVGSISSDVKSMALSAGVHHLCSWEASVPHADALREMAMADALLLVIPEGAGAERILTGKLFEYIGVGRPIVGIGPKNGDAAAIVESAVAGHMFERDEVQGLVARLNALITDPSRREAGDRARYERRAGAKQLAEITLAASGSRT